MLQAPQHVVTANPATVELAPSPFPAEWVLDGCPRAQATAIARSRDGDMMVIAWSCTKGRFRWHYAVDEMAHILSGEVFITDQCGTERRLGPGDTAFFPAGSSSIWLVTQEVRKIAVCRVALPRLLGLSLRIWNRLCRTVSELLGPHSKPAEDGGGLVTKERMSAPRSASAVPPG